MSPPRCMQYAWLLDLQLFWANAQSSQIPPGQGFWVQQIYLETSRQTIVLYAQTSRKMTFSLVFLRHAEPDLWSSIHISEGSIYFYLCLSKGDLNL